MTPTAPIEDAPPPATPRRLDPLVTRLFPKHAGSDAYRLGGLAARCDWVVLSDAQPPQAALRRVRPTALPRVIFLSTRYAFTGLRYMADTVLPMLRAPFVLVSGSEDLTVPRQIDRRWRPYDAAERAAIARILDSPLLCRWFVENLDEAGIPGMEPLPVGLVFPDGAPAGGVAVPPVPPLASRPLRALCAHRLRAGAQWQARADVTALARGPWAGFCTVPEGELPEPAFMALLAAHAFVICVEGGGLDPSPKAWQALLHGAIPILRDTPLRPAYGLLPAAFVPAWEAEHLSPAKLAAWREALAPAFDDPARRADALERLGIDFWWRRIAAAHPLGPWPAAG